MDFIYHSKYQMSVKMLQIFKDKLQKRCKIIKYKCKTSLKSMYLNTDSLTVVIFFSDKSAFNETLTFRSQKFHFKFL